MFCNNIDLNDLEQMDPMTQRVRIQKFRKKKFFFFINSKVIASIDGLRHVNKIAQDTDTELALVKAAMQNLM